MLELGGELSYGFENDDPFTGAAYFRIDLENPTRNYYFGNVTSLTLKQVLKHIFNYRDSVPPAIAETGYPEGCYVSYALEDTKITNGQTIPSGYSFKGKMNFFGWTAFAEIVSNPYAGKLKFYLELDPVNILNTVILSRSKDNQKQGPLVQFEGSIRPMTLIVRLHAYMKVWLFEAQIYLDFLPGYIELYVNVPIFYVFEAEIQGQAFYGKRLSQTEFSLFVTLKTGKIRDRITERLRSVRDYILGKLDDAKNKVNEAQRKWQAEADKVCKGGAACGYECNIHLLEKAGIVLSKKDHDVFQLSVEEWEEMKRQAEFETIYHMSETERVEKGYVVSDEVALAEHRQAKALMELQAAVDAFEASEAVQYDEEHSMLQLNSKSRSGRRRQSWGIKDLVDKGKEVGGAIGGALVDGGKNGINAVTNGGCNLSKDVCKAGCNIGSGAVDLAAKSLDAAQVVLDAVNKAAGASLAVIDSILSRFSVSITFNAELSNAVAKIATAIYLTLGSTTISLSLKIDFSVSTPLKLADTLYDRVTQFIGDKVPAFWNLM
eukprot:TRINITY_DN76_c0_g1_i4.p1 TRINITY_DN76_c0_g1~~TRINITY_DN76_c0_g1_i4.p1  ORF type:complete len:547 (+),score=169.69 TRINITY_DN76_c0_g1_i4:46-1686(+)